MCMRLKVSRLNCRDADTVSVYDIKKQFTVAPCVAVYGDFLFIFSSICKKRLLDGDCK